MAKPTIKLRPKTQRIQPKTAEPKIAPALTDELQKIAAQSKNITSQPDFTYFRPKKKQISIRMDADILAWFQAQPGKYQQLINKACRLYIEAVLKRATK